MSMHRTRVKICGMTNVDQVAFAVDQGVDAIGMILHAESKRCISVEQAQAIRRVVPPMVSLVGVFVDCETTTVNTLIEEIGLDLVQLHGVESNAQGAALTRPFIKALRAKDRVQVNQSIALYPSASAILLDPYVEGQHGGTGQLLDASCWPDEARVPLVLAGGLSDQNVVARINKFTPFAVDLNSGLEVSPGDKDPVLVERAMQAIRGTYS